MSEGTPWYRHFWPWFIVVLMAVSIAASLWTVFIAYSLGDLEIAQAPTVLQAPVTVSTEP